MEIRTVGIVGAGQMGAGITQVMAAAGYNVLLTDTSDQALQSAISKIDQNLERQIDRDKISAKAKFLAIKRISTTQTLADLGQTDLIIEAATERETIKQAIFEDL